MWRFVSFLPNRPKFRQKTMEPKLQKFPPHFSSFSFLFLPKFNLRTQLFFKIFPLLFFSLTKKTLEHGVKFLLCVTILKTKEKWMKVKFSLLKLNKLALVACVDELVWACWGAVASLDEFLLCCAYLNKEGLA